MWTCQFFQDGILAASFSKKNQKEVIVQAFVCYDTLLHMAYAPYPHQMEFYSLDFIEQEQINPEETQEIQDSIEYFLSFLSSKQEFIWWHQKETKKKNNQHTFLYEHQNQEIQNQEYEVQTQELEQEQESELELEQEPKPELEKELENNNQTFINRYEYGLCRFCLTLK